MMRIQAQIISLCLSGARNIRVEEVAEASNFLALRNDEGHYYLNGQWFIQVSERVGNRSKGDVVEK